jgi:hypothetical protein
MGTAGIANDKTPGTVEILAAASLQPNSEFTGHLAEGRLVETTSAAELDLQ